MHWLKAGREFYNLECVTKIDYSFDDMGSRLVVRVYSDLASKPLQLEGEQAALFLDSISHLEGCWAFAYSEEDKTKIQMILEKRPLREPEIGSESTGSSRASGEEKEGSTLKKQ
jgi:hypothetical protein